MSQKKLNLSEEARQEAAHFREMLMECKEMEGLSGTSKL